MAFQRAVVRHWAPSKRSDVKSWIGANSHVAYRLRTYGKDPWGDFSGVCVQGGYLRSGWGISMGRAGVVTCNTPQWPQLVCRHLPSSQKQGQGGENDPARTRINLMPPPQWRGLDLGSDSSGSARLGGSKVSPPLGVINTNPDDTKASAADRSGRALRCADQVASGGRGGWHIQVSAARCGGAHVARV